MLQEGAQKPRSPLGACQNSRRVLSSRVVRWDSHRTRDPHQWITLRMRNQNVGSRVRIESYEATLELKTRLEFGCRRRPEAHCEATTNILRHL